MTMLKNRSRFLLLAACGLALANVSACGNQATEMSRTRQVDGATAALVNGEPIYISDVELEATAQGKIEPDTPFGPDHPEFQPILDQLIDQRLLAQEAIRRGFDRDTTARRRLEAGRERILGNILVENLVANEVTEEAIDEMYAEQIKLQQLDDEVRVRHILVETEDKAKQVLQELRGGRDFTEAAFEYSEDIRTRLDGGSFGWVSPNELIDPFPAIIGDTPVGSLSEPFETEQGWHIVRVDERRTRPPKTKAEMRPEIVTFLTFTQISDILQDLRNGADIRQRNPVTRPPEPEPDPELPGGGGEAFEDGVDDDASAGIDTQ